ncbi:MAG: hypothetical protein LUE26_02545, partial [Alistipes sp.]|nr:hypothetical protein [Alistipes sp.]
AAALQDMPDITLSLNDGSIYPAAGRIETISGVIDPSTGAVSMRAEFPNADGLLRSGGSGNVIIPSTFRDAVVIPQSATFEIQDKIYAYRVVDGIARQTLIGVAKVNNGSDYIVESGIAAGDVIVTEGVGMLRDGMEIGSGSGGLQAGTADGPAGNEGDAFADDNTTEDPDVNGEAEVAHAGNEGDAFAADGTTEDPEVNGEAEVAHAGTTAGRTVNSPEAVHGGNRTATPNVRPVYITYQRPAHTICLRIPESTLISAAYTVPGGEPKAKG